ncbi:hypothetical protein CLV78_1011059 [Aliiruegeria haliotis]|uniref:Uncharacterized protein n=1 Tax=Aliiruegeria haliotis TaxID=1280846 RepID=A0A2T0S0X7_9RHOB|nr:hypothetical protein [Aliiruegeria haliotis]PRY26953.1 hypothetical protein CLV78_1011059 [Aliiruegeria haliotis]
MSERTKKFSDDLKRLIVEGNELLNSIQYECYPDTVSEQIYKAVDNDEEKAEKILKDFPSFRDDYQKWYSEAQAVIKQVLPDRLSDFISYYEYPRVRKKIDFQNYMIRDYLQGLQITSGYEKRSLLTAPLPFQNSSSN